MSITGKKKKIEQWLGERYGRLQSLEYWESELSLNASVRDLLLCLWLCFLGHDDCFFSIASLVGWLCGLGWGYPWCIYLQTLAFNCWRIFLFFHSGRCTLFVCVYVSLYFFLLGILGSLAGRESAKKKTHCRLPLPGIGHTCDFIFDDLSWALQFLNVTGLDRPWMWNGQDDSPDSRYIHVLYKYHNIWTEGFCSQSSSYLVEYLLFSSMNKL